MRNNHSLRVGLCGIGLDAYWSQFAGLEERLKGYVARLAPRLTRPGVEVFNLGLIDTPERSREAGHQCRRDLIRALDLLQYQQGRIALGAAVGFQQLSVHDQPIAIFHLQVAARYGRLQIRRIQFCAPSPTSAAAGT